MTNQDPRSSFPQRVAASLNTTRNEVFRPIYEAGLEGTHRAVFLSFMIGFDTAAIFSAYEGVSEALVGDASGAVGRMVGSVACLSVAEIAWRMDKQKRLLNEMVPLDDRL